VEMQIHTDSFYVSV